MFRFLHPCFSKTILFIFYFLFFIFYFFSFEKHISFFSMNKEIRRIATLGSLLLVTLLIFSYVRTEWRKNDDLFFDKPKLNNIKKIIDPRS